MKKGIFQSSLFNLLLLLLLFLTQSVFAGEITSINFLQEGEESQLVLEFDSDNIKANRFHVTEDKQIILDIRDANASEKVMRDLDTSEFSGSVVYVSPYRKPGSKTDIRLAIQLRDNVRSILKQVNNKLVLVVENRFGVFGQRKLELNKASGGDPTKPTSSAAKVNIPKSDSLLDILDNLTQSGPKKYIGKRISLNVKALPIEDILKIIADSSGFNIILDEEVNSAPPLTLTLTNLPWDQVLDTILDLGKLVAIKNGNILIITTQAKATEERRLLLEAEELNRAREPLITRIFPISFAVIDDLRGILDEYKSDRGRISSDVRTNSLIIKDTAKSLERIKKIVEVLDTETPQILIESKVVEANSSFTRNIGLGGQGLQFKYDPIKPKPLENTFSGPGFSFNSITSGTASTFFDFTVSVFKRISDLTFNLQFMENESWGKVITSPRIITQNKVAASITQTENRSFLIPSVTLADGTQTPSSFETVSVTLGLTVTPQVTNDGSIIMVIALNRGSFQEQVDTSVPPPTISRDVSTTVLADNGSTIVIGGIYSYTTTESTSGLPYLKEIPIVGWLFKSFYNPSVSKTELIIFLTPRIINQEEAGLVNREDTLG